MRWSFSIGRILGIPCRVHVTFLLFVAWIALVQGIQHRDLNHVLAIVVTLLLVFGCVLLHELGHAMAARRYGIGTRDIVLLPIGGVARLERMPEKPQQEMVVALAGPAVNVVIAALLWFLVRPERSSWSEIEFGSGMLGVLFTVNVVMVLFNLIPAFPMDGGRVLRAALAFKLPFPQATRIAARVGQAIAILFGGIGILAGQPMLLFVALFVFVAAGEEKASIEARATLSGVSVRDAMVTDFRIVHENDPLSRAVDHLMAGSQQDFPVLDGGGATRGMLSRADLVRALQKGGADQRVADVMQPDGQSADLAEPLDLALQRMREKGHSSLPVLDRGRLVGLLTVENISDLLLVRNALEKHARES